MADTPITLKPSAKAAVSRPLKTGAQFTLVVPRKRIVYRHWDKEKYLPGEEGQLTVLAEEMDGEKVKLVVERADRHDGPFLEVATLEAAIEGGKATAKFTFPRVEPKGRLTRAEWKRKSAKPGEQLGLHVEAQGYEGGSVGIHVERRTSDGRWEVYARWSGEIEQGKFDSIFLVPKGGAMGVQHYRFKVRTSDGRELVSAVATVDPDASGEGHDDAADTLEELEQKHREEEKQHDDALASAHQAEADRHADDLDKHHAAVEATHEEALDKLHAAELAKAEADLRLKHLGEPEQQVQEEVQGQLDSLRERLAKEKEAKLGELKDKLEGEKKKRAEALQKRQQDEAKKRRQQLLNRQDEEQRRHKELLKKKDQQKDAPRQAAGGKHK